MADNLTDTLDTNIYAEDIVVVTLELACMLVIVCGSSLVLRALRTHVHLQTTTNLLIGNLAVADLAVGLTLPFLVITHLWKALQSHRYVCLVRYATVMAGVAESAVTLLLIAVDRTIVLAYPLRYTSILTDCRLRVAVTITWLYSITLALIPAFGWNDWHLTPECKMEKFFTAGYMFLICIFFLTKWIALITLYARIFVIARDHCNRIKDNEEKQARSYSVCSNTDSSTQEIETAYKRRRQVSRHTVMVTLVLGSFICCWTPFFVVLLAQAVIKLDYDTATSHPAENVLSRLTVYSAVLGIANSMINPFIYAWKNREFRKAFRKMLGCSEQESQKNSVYLH